MTQHPLQVCHQRADVLTSPAETCGVSVDQPGLQAVVCRRHSALQQMSSRHALFTADDNMSKVARSQI